MYCLVLLKSILFFNLVSFDYEDDLNVLLNLLHYFSNTTSYRYFRYRYALKVLATSNGFITASENLKFKDVYILKDESVQLETWNCCVMHIGVCDAHWCV